MTEGNKHSARPENSIPLHASILATFILPIAQTLRQYGVDAMALIEEVGIDPATVINSDRRVSAERWFRLLERAVEESGDEAFGLAAAEQLQPAVLHGLGLAWLASDSVYDGLQRLVRFSQVISSAAQLRLLEEGEYIHLEIASLADQLRPVPAATDFAVGVVLRMSRLTLSEYLAPAAMELVRPTPEDPERFEYYLSCRPTYGRGHNRVSFVRSDIVETLATGDPTLARAADEQTELYLSRFLDQTTARDVVEKIVHHLPDGPPGQSDIASALNMSNRTLQRKLKEEDTTFKELLQDTRLQLACKYLRQPGRSILETAYLLGFSEPSTFSRAFKRWTGQSPNEFRAAGSS